MRVRVTGVPLQIVLRYSVLLRHWIRDSRQQFAGTSYLDLLRTLPGLQCQIHLLGQNWKIVDIFVFAY